MKHTQTQPRHSTSGFTLVEMILVLAIVLPGQIGSTVLDTLHAGSEHAVHYFVR